MRRTKLSRLLSLVLAVVMVLSMAPAGVFAAETATWTKVDPAAVTAEDTIMVTMTNASGTTYALYTAQSGSKGNDAKVVTVTGDTITTEGTADYGWTITSAEGGYILSVGEEHLYTIDSNNGVRMGDTQAVWAIDGNYLSTKDTAGNTRWLGVYDNNNGVPVDAINWRAYKNTTGNTKDQVLGFYKLTSAGVTPDPEPTDPEERVAYWMENAPVSGDTVIIYNAANTAVMGLGNTEKGLDGVSAEVVSEGITLNVDMAQLLVSQEEGVYTFIYDGNYLTSAPSGNGLTFEAELTDCGKWTLEASNGKWLIKNVGANYNGNYNQALEYYNGFTTYGLNTSRLGIYEMDFYLVAGAKDEGVLDELHEGDTVVIFNKVHQKALSTEYSGYYNKGTDVVFADGRLTGWTAADVWTVGLGGDGSYTFSTADGKKLAMGTEYSSTPLDEVNQDWEVTPASSADAWYIKNVARQMYLEWYADKGNWSAYANNSNEELFAHVIYRVNLENETPDPNPNPDPDPSEPSEPEVPIDTIAQALAGADGTSFTVKGVVTLLDGKNVYLQDATGGICLRTNANPSDLVLGDTIIGTGSKTVYNGLPQLGSGTYELSEGLTLEAKVVSDLSKLTTADVCTYLKLMNLEITEVYDNDGAYSSPNITVKDASGNTIQLYKAVTTKTDGAWDWKVGDKVNISGGLSIYKETLQMRNTLATEIEAYVPVETGKVTSAEDFTSGSYVLVVENGYAPGVLDGGWITAVMPVIAGDKVTDSMGGIWNLTVNGSEVELCDSNGVVVAPKGGDTNGISAGAYQWLWAFDEATATFTFAGQGADTVMLASNTGSDHKFRGYKTTTLSGSNAASYPHSFTLYKVDPTADGTGSAAPEAGAQVVLYNLSAKGVLAAEGENQVIENALTTLENGAATPGNGGVVFTVERNGEYFRFHNETYGYLCSNGTGNNAFYSIEATDDADWLVSNGKSGGFFLESRTAKFNDKYSQYLEYYSDSYKTYSMYNVTDYDIYEFLFCPVAEGVNLTGGIVNQPAVVFGTLSDAFVGSAYTFSFTVEAVFGVRSLSVQVNGTDLELTSDNFYTIPADMVQGGELTITVSGVDAKGVSFSETALVTIKDEPVIVSVSPAAGAETGEDKRPVIVVHTSNLGEGATAVMTLNGTAVEAKLENGVISYTPAEDLTDGRVTVAVTVTRADGKSVTKTWSFTVGESQYALYFGQLHSHTTYSDGSGTLDSALSYIGSLPESANVDFVAFTDHSNYFDSSSAVNPEGALYDMSIATANSQKLWSEYKGAISAFNAKQQNVVAIGGFEMTWSGGPGHINTFNTPGIVSRNNSTLNNKTSDAGMKAYYALLSQSEGVDSINQFNHPGTTFGNFSDFAYWDAVIDSRIYLVEVGNGEGQVGAGGYFPSYEQYTMALDKGWHLAPTNNQDNHKGKWGNANDARDVVLTADFSEEGIYDAIRNYRVYATEDKNLEIGYTVNGQVLGSTIEEVPEKLSVEVTVYDPDAADSISKVEVIVNSGKVAHTWENPAELSSGVLTAELAPDYSYYYIRVTEGDGDTAVTAPVWVGETLKLGISSVVCGTSTPVTGEELTITTTLFNSEVTEAKIKSLTYSVGSQVLGVDTTGYTLPASGSSAVEFKYTPEVAKVMAVTVSVVLELEGVEYTFSMDVKLDVQDASKLVYIGIDASHYNEYVAGNYKDSMGNFGALAAGYSVRTVDLKTSADLIAACGNDKYTALILTAPSRRLAAAQAELLTYTAEEVAAIQAFNEAGGTVILAGWSDNYENYDTVAGMDASQHMAATQNALLEALGSSLRISDDATHDNSLNGGQTQRLYFNAYNMDSFLMEGVEVDEANPNDRLYTEVYSQYGGASIHVVDENGAPTTVVPENVTPIVYGHTSTYSKDSDGDGLGGDNVPKYTYAEGDDRLMVLASETVGENGLIIVAGAAFMSNFEVQATIEDSGSEKNYANYKICENLVNYLNPVTITDIAEVQAQTEEGVKYTIEGIVTSNASGYDKDTAFFDCIYLQDATAGINAFPVAGNFKIGDKVRITGTTSSYQGERQIAVTQIELISEGNAVQPVEITAKELNEGKVLGSLVTLKGTVESFAYANGLVQTIMVKDAAGNLGRVFIDGYITTGSDVANLAVGASVTVTGLASYDDTFDGPAPRIRIRSRADVVCTIDPAKFEDVAENAWYYDSIYALANRGIILGTSENSFSPEETLTRAQWVTLLYRSAGAPAVEELSTFTDVPADAYYAKAFAWAEDLGIVTGVASGKGAPNLVITREQMVTMLYRFDGEQRVPFDLSGYTDVDDVTYYAFDAFEWAVGLGYIKGMTATTLAPQATATRAQAATILARYLGIQ